jgi:hypothetical protein
VTEEGTTELQKALPKATARLKEQGIALLKKKGAILEVDTSIPAQPIIGISFSCHSKDLSDEDLPHLKYLPSLQKLELGSRISDAGVAHLKGMTNLRRLFIYGGSISNKSIETLKGLSKLEAITFKDTAVTDGGILELRETLPKAKIQRWR